MATPKASGPRLDVTGRFTNLWYLTNHKVRTTTATIWNLLHHLLGFRCSPQIPWIFGSAISCKQRNHWWWTEAPRSVVGLSKSNLNMTSNGGMSNMVLHQHFDNGLPANCDSTKQSHYCWDTRREIVEWLNLLIRWKQVRCAPQTSQREHKKVLAGLQCASFSNWGILWLRLKDQDDLLRNLWHWDALLLDYH